MVIWIKKMNEKFILVKQKGIDIWKVMDGKRDTLYTVRKDVFLTRSYYLVYKKNRLSGRFENLKDVYEHLAVKIMDEKADLILGKK